MAAPDATAVDPDGHRVEFEKEHVRILEVEVKSAAR
jgi:hypothetical protein